MRLDLIKKIKLRSVLSIKGKVVTEWVFDPSERITFGRVSSEEVQERRLKVYPHQNRALDITDVRVEAPDFDVSFDKVSDEPVWELVVKTKLSAGLGTKKGSVFLTTTSERVPEAEIGILAFVTGRIGVTPEQLVIRPRTAGNINGYLFVRSYENKPLNVTKAESTIAGAKLEMSPLSNGTIWRVMLSLEDPPERNPLSGVVTITTSDTNPRYSKFEIPVTIAFHCRLRGSREVGRCLRCRRLLWIDKFRRRGGWGCAQKTETSEAGRPNRARVAEQGAGAGCGRKGRLPASGVGL